MKDHKRLIADVFLEPLYLIIIHLININIDSFLLIAQLPLGNIRGISDVLRIQPLQSIIDRIDLIRQLRIC